MSAPYQLQSDSADIAHVLHLIRDSFSYMDGRIDPPSSAHDLTATDIADHCVTGEVWVIGAPPDAVVFLTPKSDHLYVGKLAVRDSCRGLGYGHALIASATARATALGLIGLELQSRVELVENHAAFARMGFRKTGETRHRGYARTTSLTMRRALNA